MSQDPDNELERLRLHKSAATARGGQAFLRLLQLAETGDSGQVARIVDVSAFKFDLFDLRKVDQASGDDLLDFLDAQRRGQRRLEHTGPRRSRARAGGDRLMASHAVAVALRQVIAPPDPRRPALS
jgi:hypothetical protein